MLLRPEYRLSLTYSLELALPVAGGSLAQTASRGGLAAASRGASLPLAAMLV